MWKAREDLDAGYLSRRERLNARGPYLAAVPPFIVELPVRLDPEVAADSAEASTAITRFDAVTSHQLTETKPDGGDVEVSPLAAVLLRTESASSSQIEQIAANARNLALASLGEKTGPNAALVATNAEAMRTAIAMSDDMSAQTILDVQAALLSATAPEHTGRFRQDPVWIGGRGSTPHSAIFVPPQASRVPQLIDDLIGFTRRTDIPPLTQAAIAHAQFETIHPFPDGNGRTGRALVHAMLRDARVTQRMTVPVSSGLLANVDDYYDALGQYRKGDPNPIVDAFSRAALHSVDNGRRLVEDLIGINANWRTRIKARKDSVQWRALPLLISQPAITINYLSEQTCVGWTAAERAVAQLVEAGVLEPVGNAKRSRVWTASEVTAALDQFAARAGRRNYVN